MLVKNSTVTEQNRGLLVEALRAIAEILIWGDQNDSTVFESVISKKIYCSSKTILLMLIMFWFIVKLVPTS